MEAFQEALMGYDDFADKRYKLVLLKDLVEVLVMIRDIFAWEP